MSNNLYRIVSHVGEWEDYVESTVFITTDKQYAEEYVRNYNKLTELITKQDKLNERYSGDIGYVSIEELEIEDDKIMPKLEYSLKVYIGEKYDDKEYLEESYITPMILNACVIDKPECNNDYIKVGIDEYNGYSTLDIEGYDLDMVFKQANISLKSKSTKLFNYHSEQLAKLLNTTKQQLESINNILKY